METNALVLDALVIVKWFTQEEKRSEALEIREKFINQKIDIVVPDLILYEISNALRYNPRFDEEDVKEAIDSLIKMELNIITPTKDIIERAIEISFLKNISVYDAYYIALAENIGFDLVTADEKLSNKVREGFGFVKVL